MEKQANVTKVPIDVEKYINKGEKEKLEFPNKPQKSKKDEFIKYISEPEMEQELEYPTKKMATEEFKFKLDDVMDTGEKEKLIFDKKVELPNEGEVKITVDKKLPEKYIAEGEKGNLEKAKEFTIDEAQSSININTNKYFLTFEKAKPFQKQFSVKKKSSSPEIYLSDVIGYTFLSFLKWAKEDPIGLQELLKQIDTYMFYDTELLKQATLQKFSGRSLEEWLKILKEKGAPRKVRRKFKHIWESSIKRGESEEYAARAAIDSLPAKYLEKPTKYHGPEQTGPIKKGTIDDEINRKQEEINKLQEQLAEAQKQLADLQTKKSEELAQQLNK